MQRSGGFFFFFTTLLFLGLAFFELVLAKSPAVITRRTDNRPSVDEFEENVAILAEKLCSLRAEERKSEEKTSVRTNLRSNLPRSQKETRATGASSNSSNRNDYINIFSSLYYIYQPVLLDSFIQNYPQAVVCMLADRTQCGWQADLTATLSSRLSEPVLSFLSYLKSQTCSSTSNILLRMVDSSSAQFAAFQDVVVAVLSSSLPLSDTFTTALNRFVGLTMAPVTTFLSDYIMNTLQIFVEFLTVGLQFGINLPTLDQKQQCQQGDLKQLIMWGLAHNISWSFGDSIITMLLSLDSSQCSFTDTQCQAAQSSQLGRFSTSQVGNQLASLTCDQKDVTQFNDTMCAEVLASGSQVSDALYGVCKAMSTLSHSEMVQVWRNTCHMIQLTLSPLLEPCPSLASESNQRVVRSTLSLSQLLCNYENWTTTEAVDPGLVTMCSDNDLEGFLQWVCSNLTLMQALTAVPSNSWVWDYCANASERYVVMLYCVYDTWTPQTLDPSIVALCWDHDQARMETLLCQNLDFFMIVYSNQENGWLTLNCTQVPTPQPLDINTLVSQSCRYSEWRNLGTISTDQLSLCIQNDEAGFVSKVCANSMFVSALVLNNVNAWVKDYCAFALMNPPTFSQVVTTTPSPATQTNSLLSSRTFTASSTNYQTVPQVGTSVPLSSFALSPSVSPSVTPMYSSTTLSPTVPLAFPTPSVSVFSSGSQTALPVASSITLFPSSPTASNFIFPSLLSTSSTTLSIKVSTTVSQAIPGISPSPTAPLTVSPTIYSSAFSTISPTTSSSNLSTTPPKTGRPPVPSTSDWCKYSSWAVLPVDPSIVGLCWQFDMAAFYLNVCCNKRLLDLLTLDLQNQWLGNVCSGNDTADLLLQVCLYSEWGKPTIVDMTDLALCADLDTANFTQKVCTNATVLHNLLANLDNTWLLAQCSNLTGAAGEKANLMGFQPSEQCQYSSWSIALPDAALLALCWDYDRARFISAVCLQPAMLAFISQEPSSLWVSMLCGSYSSNTNTTNTVQPCIVKELIKGLNWSCNVDLNAACQPGSSQFEGLQVFFRCGLEVLLPKMHEAMSTEAASTINRATNVLVVVLLLLEENGMTTLSVTDNIRQNVLESVAAFLERERTFSNKQLLLQCFGKVLTSLMQTGRDVTGNDDFFIQEYFRIPLVSLRSVLSSVDITTVRLILQFLIRNQAGLQLTDEYLHTMVSVFLQIHLRLDTTLFLELGPLLNLASPEDIMLLPPLQNTDYVLNTINGIISNLSLEQRQAFGWWYGQSVGAVNLTAGDLDFVQKSGNLIAYLPFTSFQRLSPAQLLDGLDVLLKNDLGTLKQQFIAQSITGAFRNLTEGQFRSLGTLTCMANLSSLLAYVGTSVMQVIQENIKMCLAQGIDVSSSMISSLFLNSTELQSPATLSPQKISQLAYFLPLLGVDFLQQLTPSQLLPSLNVLASVPFTPTQAAVIMDKVSPSLNLSVPSPGALSKLGSLLSGIKMETVWGLPTDSLLTALANYSQYGPNLTPPQASGIVSKLWGSPMVVAWLDKMAPLLLNTPLLCVIGRAPLLLSNGTAPYARVWNTQQAKTLFNVATTTIKSLSVQQFTSLGTVAQGVSCKDLTKLFQTYTSVSSMRDVLRLLREQPVLLHPSLKKCVIDALYEFDFSVLLEDMGSQIALSFQMSTIKKFPVSMMDTLRRMIVQEPEYFLAMPKTKQAILVDKVVQRLNMHTGAYSEEEFRSLGVMATFVVDEVFVQLDRTFFVDNMEFLQGFCFDSSKRAMVASMLQEIRTFGPVQNWTATTLNQVDRFLFFLSESTIQLIPPALMSQERVERLFSSQQQWERGRVGSLCEPGSSALFSTQQFVLQFFLGFLKPGRATSLTPTCESLHMTRPAAWPVGSLTDMPSVAFRRCLELVGRDSLFSPIQLSLLLRKTKDVYGAVSSFTSSVTSQLGYIATQLSADELASLKLSEICAVSTLGAVNTWTRKQLGVLFSTILNSTKQSPSQLDSSSFVAMGYIICGIDVPVIRSLNGVEFGKAMLWLGRLNLTCSEEQLQAMITLLSQSLVFGPISSWGPEVFIEIGALAAGIPDMAMSALVKEQIEGITPLAISLIPAKKFAVVFNQAQISMFSYEQAAAVTAAQRLQLSSVQETALSMVLSPMEDKPVDFRGRSFGVATRICPHLCSLLVMMLMLLFSRPF